MPARWLLRFDAFLQLLELARDGDARGLARLAPQPRPRRDGATDRAADAAPRTASAVRDALSVTQIETWMRDPYGVYARHILKLRPLDPIDQDPDLSDLGNIVHEALHRFVAAYPDALPEDALEQLIAIGRGEVRSPSRASPRSWRSGGRASRRSPVGSWRPRRCAARRWTRAVPSCRGELKIADVKPPFTLNARADRIDRRSSGELVIIDYKTGTVPPHKEVLLGLSPQLSLEAAIALETGFKDLAYGEVAALQYWKLSGGAVAGEIKEVRHPGRSGAAIDANDVASQAKQGLINLLRTFGALDAAYPPAPRAEYKPSYTDYDHLARTAEWTVTQTDEEAGEFG